MMEEELRQEAEGYFETSCPYSYADTEDDLKHDVTEAYMAGAEPREKRIKEFEKENAKLKETVTKMNNVITKTFSNLTKAREIIRDLLSYLYSVEYDHVSDLEQAEQFLKEVDE